MPSKLTVEHGVITFTQELDDVPQFYPQVGDTYYTPVLSDEGWNRHIWNGAMVDYQRIVGHRVFETPEEAMEMHFFILRLVDFALS